MGKWMPVLFYHPGSPQLFFDQVVKKSLVLPYPRRQLLFDDLPDTVFPLHPEDDTVASVIAHIHREQTFLQAIRFAEVKLSQSAIGLYQLGELNVANELYLHKDPFELLLS